MGCATPAPGCSNSRGLRRHRGLKSSSGRSRGLARPPMRRHYRRSPNVTAWSFIRRARQRLRPVQGQDLGAAIVEDAEAVAEDRCRLHRFQPTQCPPPLHLLRRRHRPRPRPPVSLREDVGAGAEGGMAGRRSPRQHRVPARRRQSRCARRLRLHDAKEAPRDTIAAVSKRSTWMGDGFK